VAGQKTDLPPELVLVETANLYLALLADHIEEVLAIPREMVESVDIKYARGVTEDHLVLLDIHALFADERLMIGGKVEH
jgi:chemotaxis signal transduction protein